MIEHAVRKPTCPGFRSLESLEIAAKMAPLSATANEQVLDRLQALLASEDS